MSAVVEDLNKRLIQAAKNNDFDEVKILCEKGAEANYALNENGTWGASKSESAIHYAILKENFEITKYLLENGAKTDAIYADYDWRGCGSSLTAFQMASSAGDEYIVLFLKHNADPNLLNKSETHSMRTDACHTWVLLHNAIKNENIAVLDELLKNPRTDITIVENEDVHNERGYNQERRENCLHMACKKQNYDIVCRLFNILATNNQYDTQCQHNFINGINSYIEQIPNELYVDNGSNDPRVEGYISPVKCIKIKQTALHIAIQMKNQNIVDVLVSHGADPSISYQRGDENIPTESLCQQNDIILDNMHNGLK